MALFPLHLVRANAREFRAYLSLVSGSAGRVVLSLAYFVAVANTLTIDDFGLFATASSIGVVLSRLAAFGFVSPLYRAATVKRRLLGVYAAGLLAGTALSLPLIALVAALVYILLFAGDVGWTAFAMILVAEILFWRGVEIVIIVLNGLNRFAAGALLLVFSMALRAAAALAFAFFADGSLAAWASAYLIANAACLFVALVFFFPPARLRWKPKLYLARWVDAVSVAAAEMLFYLQSELDKTLVLAIGGPQTAGIYAIVMRLIDLTALPVRAGLTIFVQRLMRQRNLIAGSRRRVTLELAVAVVSTAGIAAMALFLYFFPRALGDNVALAAAILPLVLAVPAMRNLIEYHSELLYATGRTVIRALNLALLGALKAALLGAVLILFTEENAWALALNLAFLPLYVVSAFVAYRSLDRVRPLSAATA